MPGSLITVTPRLHVSPVVALPAPKRRFDATASNITAMVEMLLGDITDLSNILQHHRHDETCFCAGG